jgi:hypothetical protein
MNCSEKAQKAQENSLAGAWESRLIWSGIHGLGPGHCAGRMKKWRRIAIRRYG